MKPQEFLNFIVPHILAAVKKNGWGVPSVIIAMSITESGWGASELSYKYHNYFGMKCGSVWKGRSVNYYTKEEYTPGTLTTIRDNFRAYDSLDEGIQGYFDFLNWSHYDSVRAAKTPKDYMNALQKCGYFTSTTIITTWTKLIEQYNLTQYDNGYVQNFEPVNNSVHKEEPAIVRETRERLVQEIIDGKWDNGKQRRYNLEAAGCNFDTLQSIVNERCKK